MWYSGIRFVDGRIRKLDAVVEIVLGIVIFTQHCQKERTEFQILRLDKWFRGYTCIVSLSFNSPIWPRTHPY